MASVNKVILIGNLGADPEVRYTPSGRAVANLRIATTDTWNDKDGNRQERTEWHTVTVWGKQAEHCGQYLSKGRQVYVEGRLQSREYTDRDGNNRKVWDVIAQQVTFLGGGNRGGGGGGGGKWGGNQGGGGSSNQGGGGSWGSNQGGGGGNQGGGGSNQGGGGSNQGGGGWGGGGWGGGNQGGGGSTQGGGGSTQGGGSAPPPSNNDDDPIPF